MVYLFSSRLQEAMEQVVRNQNAQAKDRWLRAGSKVSLLKPQISAK